MEPIKRRDLSTIVCEEEFRAFIGEPLTRTRTEVRQHFNLDHDTLKVLLSKYDLTHYLMTGNRRYENLENHLLENPGTTYNDLAQHLNTSWKNVYNAVEKRNLQHLITPEDRQDVWEKSKETNLKRYGVENVMQHPGIRKKMRATNLKRYGVEHAIQHPDVQEKQRQTMLERYGTPHPPVTRDRVKKQQATMKKRYGKSSLMKTPEAILNARKTLLNNGYRESRGWYTINEENVKWLLDVDTFKTKMLEYGEKPTIIEFIREHDLPIRTTYNFIKNNELSHYFAEGWGTSQPEKDIQEFFLSLGVSPDDMILNDRTVIKPLEIDIYLPKHNLGIEFNGTYYHSTLMSPDKYKHQTKALMALEQGIVLYQIFEFDWNQPHKQEIIKSQLRNLLGLNTTKIYARDTEIREVDNKTTKEFMEANHMQGDGNLNKQVNYGLYHNNKLVYMMTFGKWRRGYKGVIDYEIFRSCSLLNTTVVGGASKLFKHFIREHPNKVVGTYSNLQTGDGSLYETLGFTYSHTTEPTSFKVNRRGEILTLFSTEYQESRGTDSNEFYFEIYNVGSKLWIYDKKEN